MFVAELTVSNTSIVFFVAFPLCSPDCSMIGAGTWKDPAVLDGKCNCKYFSNS